MWRKYSIGSDSALFPVFSKAIKQVQYDKKELTISIINKERSKKCKARIKETFKFLFDWQDEDTCGIEIYKKIGDEGNEKST